MAKLLSTVKRADALTITGYTSTLYDMLTKRATQGLDMGQELDARRHEIEGALTQMQRLLTTEEERQLREELAQLRSEDQA